MRPGLNWKANAGTMRFQWDLMGISIDMGMGQYLLGGWTSTNEQQGTRILMHSHTRKLEVRNKIG
jgi:hypothetical protein